MILCGDTIRARCKEMGLIIPFVEKTERNGLSFGLSYAGYDIRVVQTLLLNPGDFVLASSLEHFDMPLDLIAQVTDKSTWARVGIAVQNTVIEPGWKGHLTLEITNHSRKIIEIKNGDPIAQILFTFLDKPVDRGYAGKYQNQENKPVPAIFE